MKRGRRDCARQPRAFLAERDVAATLGERVGKAKAAAIFAAARVFVERRVCDEANANGTLKNRNSFAILPPRRTLIEAMRIPADDSAS